LTATGFAVAGGGSRRMGRDKALLPWGAATLLDHALHRLREACGDVVILSGDRPRYLDRGAPAVADAVSHAGPLGALVTALDHTRTDLVLLLAVDIPFAPVALLRNLVERADGWDAAVPVAGGREHPLCAVYRRTCAGPARSRLAAGEFKMTSFWPDVRVRKVVETELAAFGDPAALLRNLNTWMEYEAARTEGT
jgi:molybdopterin-guanine dinucleotide biosynthesis protein A